MCVCVRTQRDDKIQSKYGFYSSGLSVGSFKMSKSQITSLLFGLPLYNIAGEGNQFPVAVKSYFQQKQARESYARGTSVSSLWSVASKGVFPTFPVEGHPFALGFEAVILVVMI